MGNGGSSCDAAHITTEFMHPVTTGRKALGFTNLTADIATMTAVANTPFLFSFKKGYKSDNALLLFIFSLPSDANC
jgi:phosphoheptose isomerase